MLDGFLINNSFVFNFKQKDIFIHGQNSQEKKLKLVKGVWIFTCTPYMQEIIVKNRAKGPLVKSKSKNKKIGYDVWVEPSGFILVALKRTKQFIINSFLKY